MRSNARKGALTEMVKKIFVDSGLLLDTVLSYRGGVVRTTDMELVEAINVVSRNLERVSAG